MKKALLFIGAIAFMATGVMAQEDLKPQKYEDVSWHRVVKVDYKPGKVSRAKEIIEIFKAAGAEAGTPGPVSYWFATGSYDAMFIWKMENGPADMEWWRTANNIKWRKAMIKQVGSEEKMKEIQEEYGSLISSASSDVVRKEL